MPPAPVPKQDLFKVPQAFAHALELHTLGRLPEAERLYTEILTHRPDHFDTLQMLSVIKLAHGQPAEALRLISKAMHQRKPSPQILVNYGMILHALDRSEEAIASFDAAIKQKSKFAEAHNNRGAVLGALDRHEEALESLGKALVLKEDYADAHYNLGSSLRVLGRYDEALVSLNRALALQPNHIKALNNRGNVMEGLTRLEDALADYDRALAISPDFKNARDNRGRVLIGLDRIDDAIENFTTAIKINPRDAEAWHQRGRCLLEVARDEEGIADLAQALALDPGHAEARFASCFAELPVVYRTEGEIQRHRITYEQKLRELKRDVEQGSVKGDLVKAIGVRHPFFLAYQGGNDRALQEIYGGMVSGILARSFPPAPLPPPPAKDERIRLGIVSSFFYRHSNWKIPIRGWISQIDRKRFHVTGYHLGVIRDDQTEIAEKICDRFVHRTLKTDGWRREILADAPHALIYPGLLMDLSSVQLAAQRLAPVQFNSWGHPETSGLPSMDYFLSSDLMEPPDGEEFYTEKLVRLPNLSIYYEPVVTEPVPVTREEVGLRAGATVFWSAQSLYKYLPQNDDVFVRIARAVGDCQFVFLRHFGAPRITALVRERLTAAFAEAGMDAARHCVFLDRMSQSKFVAAAGLADVFLDSIGWSGCNSALECLAQALPLVTFEGTSMRGRHSAAILRMLDIPDTIAASVDDYVAIAIRLGQDADFRRQMAARMAENRDKVYRDRAPITALEDIIEIAVRGHAP
jgi:protein O-GlcNAc transferase